MAYLVKIKTICKKISVVIVLVKPELTCDITLKVGGGPGLAFITFSDAFLRLDASPFWAAMLFLMLFLLGIDSEFGTMEAAVTPIFDAEILPKWMKKYMFTGKDLGADIYKTFSINIIHKARA